MFEDEDDRNESHEEQKDFMDEIGADLEDCFIHEIYLGFRFEEWPLLETLKEEAQEHLSVKISQDLAAVECKTLGIRARTYALQLVLKLDVAVSIDDVINIVANAGRTFAEDPNVEEGPATCSVESISPADTLDAVLLLRS